MDLKSIHFILTYMCNFECDHCFLYCSPSSNGSFTLNQIKNVIDECQKIETIKSFSFEGGEPFLLYPLLLESIKLSSERGYTTAIESNCYWATTVEDAELWLNPLLKAGLSLLEASDDAFHHGNRDETPAKRAIAAAQKIGLGVYSIRIIDPAQQKDYYREKGKPIYIGIPKFRGRAVEKLTIGLAVQSWENYTECPLENLRNPSRVHVDPFGNVHLCQGLIMGNLMKTPLSDLIKNYDPDKHPVVGPLLAGGPAQLLRTYAVKHEDEYVDACHLCSKICTELIDTFPEYLAPRQIYGINN